MHPLYAAQVAGIHRIFKAGGAQAIAAMAYGTESIPKVYKIFGPGNQYVTAAKQLVSLTDTAIDIPAGPSEVEIIADETAIITVCFNALSIAVSLPRPSYQRVENPSNTQTLEEELKENTTITAIGA